MSVKTKSQPKKRINVSVTNEAHEAVARLAARDNVPQATKATELIQRALELEEDRYFSQVAKERMNQTTKWSTHESAWK